MFLYVYSLIFQATASRLSNGHINFAKARNLAQKLKEFAIWKDVESPYAKTPVVAEFLQNSPLWSEKGMLTTQSIVLPNEVKVGFRDLSQMFQKRKKPDFIMQFAFILNEFGP